MSFASTKVTNPMNYCDCTLAQSRHWRKLAKSTASLFSVGAFGISARGRTGFCSLSRGALPASASRMISPSPMASLHRPWSRLQRWNGVRGGSIRHRDARKAGLVHRFSGGLVFAPDGTVHCLVHRSGPRRLRDRSRSLLSLRRSERQVGPGLLCQP